MLWFLLFMYCSWCGFFVLLAPYVCFHILVKFAGADLGLPEVGGIPIHQEGVRFLTFYLIFHNFPMKLKEFGPRGRFERTT